MLTPITIIQNNTAPNTDETAGETGEGTAPLLQSGEQSAGNSNEKATNSDSDFARLLTETAASDQPENTLLADNVDAGPAKPGQQKTAATAMPLLVPPHGAMPDPQSEGDRTAIAPTLEQAPFVSRQATENSAGGNTPAISVARAIAPGTTAAPNPAQPQIATQTAITTQAIASSEAAQAPKADNTGSNLDTSKTMQPLPTQTLPGQKDVTKAAPTTVTNALNVVTASPDEKQDPSATLTPSPALNAKKINSIPQDARTSSNQARPLPQSTVPTPQAARSLTPENISTPKKPEAPQASQTSDPEPERIGLDNHVKPPQLKAEMSLDANALAKTQTVSLALETTQAEVRSNFSLASIDVGSTASQRMLIAPNFDGPSPLNTAAAKEAQAIINQIVSNVARTGDRLDLRLDPPELGRVSMTLTIRDDGIIASVSADRADTDALLRKHGEDLQRALRDSGFGDVSLSFEQKSGGETGSDHKSDKEAARGDQPLQADTQKSSARSSQSANGGLDIRV